MKTFYGLSVPTRADVVATARKQFSKQLTTTIILSVFWVLLVFSGGFITLNETNKWGLDGLTFWTDVIISAALVFTIIQYLKKMWKTVKETDNWQQLASQTFMANLNDSPVLLKLAEEFKQNIGFTPPKLSYLSLLVAYSVFKKLQLGENHSRVIIEVNDRDLYETDFTLSPAVEGGTDFVLNMRFVSHRNV